MKIRRVATVVLALLSFGVPSFAADRLAAPSRPMAGAMPPRLAAAPPEPGQASVALERAPSASVPASAGQAAALERTQAAAAQVQAVSTAGNDEATRRFFARVFGEGGSDGGEIAPAPRPLGFPDDVITTFLQKSDRYVYPSEKNDAISRFVREQISSLSVAQARRLLDSMIIKDKQLSRTSAMQSYNNLASYILQYRRSLLSWDEAKEMMAGLKPVPGGSADMAWPIKDAVMKAYARFEARDAAEAVEIASYASSAGERNWALRQYFDGRADLMPLSELRVLLEGMRRVNGLSGHGSRADTRKEMIKNYYGRRWPNLAAADVVELATWLPWSDANWMLEDFSEKRLSSLTGADIDALIAGLRPGFSVLSESSYTAKLAAERIRRRWSLAARPS